MNREDLIRESVDRGIADGGTAGKVYDAFRDFLFSAMRRGQSVHVPHFGTFMTRVAGIRKSRKMPVFEPEEDLSSLVNERFRDMKTLLLGTYEQKAPTVGVEWLGKEIPYDPLVDEVGKEFVIDTTSDVTTAEFDRENRVRQRSPILQEANLMPKLNLRDDGLEPESGPLDTERMTPPPPTLRDVGGGGGGRVSPILLVALIVVAFGGGVFLLNQFKVIHLWGKKAPKVAESIEPSLPEQEPATEQGSAQEQGTGGTPGVEPAPGMEQSTAPAPTEQTPEVKTPEVKAPIAGAQEEKTPPSPKATQPAEKLRPAVSSGSGGKFTLQVSSWPSQAKANEEVSKLTKAGYEAYAQSAAVSGATWYRVRVGHYGSEREAQDAAGQMQKMVEGSIWVARAAR